MNLQTYFKQQHEYHISDQQKADLFKRINKKRLEQSTMRRHFSYKKISYTFIVIAFVLFIFGGIFLEKNTSIDNPFFSSNPNNPNNIYADYIAEIIEFNGEYTIQNGNKIITSPYLHNNDTVYLKQGSEILFTLNDGSQAKLIGPAEFSLNKENNDYKIYLISGNFFKIFNETTNNNTEIIAEGISIHSNKNQPLDIQIAKEDTEILIKNNGGDAKITISTNKEGSTSKVEKTIAKELISIKNNDINTLTNTETFTEFLAKNNISETLSLTTPPKQPLTTNNDTTWTQNTSTPQLTTTDIDIPELSQILNPENTTPTAINEHVKIDLGLENERKVPTPDQNDVLTNTLNSFFLMNNFEKIYIALLENNTAQQNKSLSDLAEKINLLAKSFNLEMEASADFTSIQSLLSNLKNTFETKYYIAPSQLSQLEKIAHRCKYLTNLSSPETILPREEFKNTLPEQLKLK